VSLRRTAVINAVGLTPSLIGENTPRLRAFRDAGRLVAIEPVLPAVTCTVQATYLTGAWPGDHGIIGNGWYDRDNCEVRFWRQSNKLVQRPRLWDAAKCLDPTFTCANLFWWHAMYSSADITVTPRPMYTADGRKIPDVWTNPPDLRRSLQSELGQFPLFHFWGPATSIRSTQWIADAALHVERRFSPTLTLIYLPHLDYNLQRIGPGNPAIARDLAELDEVCGDLIDAFAAANVQVTILSEYGIVPVSRPVHLNRMLRSHGLLTVRDELGRELLDAGASAAFAVADHQLAHVYVNDPSRLHLVRDLLAATPGVARVLDDDGKRLLHLDHPRSGDLIALAEPDAWFAYYYWTHDDRAPDFARTVDIHRKPGYDPAELFLDPSLSLPRVRIAAKLLRRKLGFRILMDVIPLDATLVRGSHGLPTAPDRGPLLMTSRPEHLGSSQLPPTSVSDLIMRHLHG
jgi:predicted AlkP superfamily pyrophosphatase or phosphodiesterase